MQGGRWKDIGQVGRKSLLRVVLIVLLHPGEPLRQSIYHADLQLFVISPPAYGWWFKRSRSIDNLQTIQAPSTPIGAHARFRVIPAYLATVRFDG